MMRHSGSSALRATVTLACALLLAACGAGPESTTLIRGARVVDGTGAPSRRADVRIRGDRIAAVGQLEPVPGERSVDAAGSVLAPGFIDTHSHHDRGLADRPDALGAVSQGITTIVAGQDGGSNLPLAEYFAGLEAEPVAVNVASYAGHGTLRRRVLGDDFRRPATAAEVDSMRRLLRGEMAAGALGLSTGLEYDPGIYATTEEVVALAREAARGGGRYISHVRSEDRRLRDAIDEAIRVGREAEIPVQISHMKLAMRSLFGRAGELLERLDAARADGVDVTADVYPYTYWQSTMTVLFPERNFDDRATAEFALSELTTPEGMLIARFEPDTAYVGMTLAEIAARRGTDPATTYMELIAEALEYEEETGEGAESVVVTAMHPDDVRELVAWPHTNIASDGALSGRHPRGFGAFPRVLGRYVREEGVLPLEAAVRKMTALSAEHVGIAERGVIRPGAYADLVLFDPDGVLDRATAEDPWRTAVGIERVWVNGVEVYGGGEPTGERPGRVVRRAEPAARIDSIFAAYDSAGSPGCAVGVFRDGEPVFERGYGTANLEHGIPITPSSVFRIGSVSKQFAAAAILLLEREGRLSLDDDVRRHVPELPDYGTPITIRHLLHHTSGVRDYLTLMSLAGRRSDDFYAEEDLVAMLARQRELNFDPGAEFLYSNSGYFLLSEIVKRVTGSSLREYAAEAMFEPLVMRRTHFHDDHDHIVPLRATGYAPLDDGGYRISVTTLEMVGDGGVFTSIRDLAHWERNFLSPAIGGEDFTERMHTRGVLNDGDTLDYALGLRHETYRGLHAVGHGGSFVGYRAATLRFPSERVGIYCLCNVSSADPSRLVRRVADVVLADRLAALEESADDDRSEEPDDDKDAPYRVPAAELVAYGGDYYSPELDATYRIRPGGDSLRLTVGNWLDGALRPMSRDAFEGRIRLRFTRDDGGAVAGFVLDAGRVQNMRFVRREVVSSRE